MDKQKAKAQLEAETQGKAIYLVPSDAMVSAGASAARRRPRPRAPHSASGGGCVFNPHPRLLLAQVTQDWRPDRIRVFFDPVTNTVARPPRIG